jgi:hypothetical protein
MIDGSLEAYLGVAAVSETPSTLVWEIGLWHKQTLVRPPIEQDLAPMRPYQIA